jgi:hypothetical protein
MRSSVVRQVGGQQPLAHAHDMEMWMRIAAFSDVAYIEGVDQALHREHAGSLSTQLDGMVADYRERKAAFDVLFTGVAAQTPGSAELWATALSRLAVAALEDACHAYDRGRADEHLIAGLVEFAATCRDIEPLPQWRHLRRRQGSLSGRLLRPVHVLVAVRRSLQCRWARRHWATRGCP